MKTISLRKFRDSIPDLTEPVDVVRRSPDGEYVILGTWEPKPSDEDLAAALDIVTPSWRDGFGSSRPAPKPKR